MIMKKFSLKAIVIGLIVSLGGAILISRLYWFCFVKFMNSHYGGEAFLDSYPYAMRLFLICGVFILPSTLNIIGGYVTANTAKSFVIFNSLVVGLLGATVMLYSAYTEPDLNRFFYTLLGVIWLPVTILGALISKYKNKLYFNKT